MNTGETFAERLDSFMRSRSVTQEILATHADVAQSTVSRWLSGDSKPHDKVIRKICERMEINPHWLLTGEGPRDAIPEVSFSRRPNLGGDTSAESPALRSARERVEILKLQIEEAELRKRLAELEGTLPEGVTRAGFEARKDKLEARSEIEGNDNLNTQRTKGSQSTIRGNRNRNFQA